MAKDDYYVLVYQILAHLYQSLKHGDNPDPKMLAPSSALLQINERYWGYIFEHLLRDEYIEGITITKTYGGQVIVNNLEECCITPKGIAYLCENSTIRKAYRFLKDAKSIIPFKLPLE